MTRLPDYPDMGGVTLVQAQQIATDLADAGAFGPKVSAYTNAALAVLPAGDASRTSFESAALTRIDRARAAVDYAAPIAAGNFPQVYEQPTMTQNVARKQINRALYATLSQLTSNVVLQAVQALPTTDATRQAWQTMLEVRLASEQLIVTNGPVQLADLNPGPAPAP